MGWDGRGRGRWQGLLADCRPPFVSPTSSFSLYVLAVASLASTPGLTRLHPHCGWMMAVGRAACTDQSDFQSSADSAFVDPTFADPTVVRTSADPTSNGPASAGSAPAGSASTDPTPAGPTPADSTGTVRPPAHHPIVSVVGLYRARVVRVGVWRLSAPSYSPAIASATCPGVL